MSGSKGRVARIAGVPISWVILCVALLAGTSVIPLVIFPAGGYDPLTLAIWPLVGIMIGPWAGFVAGVISGIIATFISPGGPAQWGLIWAPFMIVFWYSLPITFAGLAANKDQKYRWSYYPMVIGAYVIALIFPYYYPGPPTFPHPPSFFALASCLWFSYIGALLYPIFFWKLIPGWFEHESSRVKLWIGGYLLTWLCSEPLHPLSFVAQNWSTVLPPTYMIGIYNFYVPLNRQPVFAIGATLIVSVLLALRKAKLRPIPGTVWAKRAAVNE